MDSYLTPPAGDYDPVLNFRRPSRRRRRPSQLAKRKQSYDQQVAASDFGVNEVTVLPPSRSRNITISTLKPLLNVDASKVNYNYHPIIDFFDKDKPQPPRSIERIGNANQRNAWRPMVNRRG